MSIKSLIHQSIWKKNEKDDFRDCEKKLIFADFSQLAQGIPAAPLAAAEQIFAGQEAAGETVREKRRAKRNAPKLMKFTVCLTEKILGAGIDELDLCSRASNSLKRSGIMTVGELLDVVNAPDRIGLVRQLGEKSRQDIFWQLFAFHYMALPQDMRARYVKECAALDDPPKAEPGQTAGTDPEGCGEKLMTGDTDAFTFMDLSEPEQEVADALLEAGISGSFVYPVYLTEALKNTDLEELTLSVRAYHSLKRGGYSTVGDFLLDTDGSGVVPVRNCGAKTSGEIFARMYLVMASLLSEEQRSAYVNKVAGMNRSRKPEETV